MRLHCHQIHRSLLKGIITGLLVTPAALFAGPAYKAPVIEDPVCAVPFTGSVAAGYESAYMFRGIDFGGDAPWAGIDLSWAITDAVTFDFGTWYINPTDGNGFTGANPVDELDIYASTSFPLGPFDASFGVVALTFPDGGGPLLLNAQDGGTADYELFLSLGKTIAGIDIAYSAIHSLYLGGVDGNTWFHDVNFGKGFDLTDCVSLGFGAGLGFSDGYNGFSGYNHSYVSSGLTFALTDAAALDLYIAGSFASDDLEAAAPFGGVDNLHGGASLSVSF
ncbi:MAG: TorF family putative porin [Verrucomicrobiota bacterium]